MINTLYSVIELSGYSPTDDPLVFEKELIYVDDFVKKTKNEEMRFSVDVPTIDHWVNTFNEMKKNGVDVPIPLGHTVDAEKRRGTVEKLMRKPNSKGVPALFMLSRFVDADAAKLARSTNVSIYVEPEFVDGRGNKYVRPVRHVALTDYPVIPGLEPFKAIALSNEPLELGSEDQPRDDNGRFASGGGGGGGGGGSSGSSGSSGGSKSSASAAQDRADAAHAYSREVSRAFADKKANASGQAEYTVPAPSKAAQSSSSAAVKASDSASSKEDHAKAAELHSKAAELHSAAADAADGVNYLAVDAHSKAETKHRQAARIHKDLSLSQNLELAMTTVPPTQAASPAMPTPAAPAVSLRTIAQKLGIGPEVPEASLLAAIDAKVTAMTKPPAPPAAPAAPSPPRPIAASFAKLLKDSRQARINALLTTKKITPAVKSKLEADHLNDEALSLSLSNDDVNDTLFSCIISTLELNEPVITTGSKTGAQSAIKLAHDDANLSDNPVLRNAQKRASKS